MGEHPKQTGESAQVSFISWEDTAHRLTHANVQVNGRHVGHLTMTRPEFLVLQAALSGRSATERP